jgi:hypothetical protein
LQNHRLVGPCPIFAIRHVFGGVHVWKSNVFSGDLFPLAAVFESHVKQPWSKWILN